VNALRVNVTETLNPKSNRLDALIAKHTAGMIRTEALRFLPNGNFSASHGWKERFKKRKRLTEVAANRLVTLQPNQSVFDEI
jgi:hypothetical protein